MKNFMPTKNDLEYIFKDMEVLELEQIKDTFWKKVGYPGGMGLPENWMNKYKGFEGDEEIMGMYPPKGPNEPVCPTLRHKARLCTYYRIAKEMGLTFDHPVFERISEREAG